MSFEVFYNFFYNVANSNVKDFFSPVERALSQRSQARRFAAVGKLTLFNSSGVITSNKGFTYPSDSIIKFNDNNSEFNNQLKYLIIYSQLLSELTSKIYKYRNSLSQGRNFGIINASKKFKIGNKIYTLSLYLRNPDDYNTLLGMARMSFSDAQSKFSQNGKLVINGRVVGRSSITNTEPEPQNTHPILLLGGITSDSDPTNSTIYLSNTKFDSYYILTSSRKQFGSVVYNKDLYVFGGVNGSAAINSTEKLTNLSTSFEKITYNLNTARYAFGYSLVNNRIYVTGGSTTNPNRDLNSTEFLDLNNITNGWQPSIDLPPNNLINHNSVSYNNKLYVFGGEINLTDAIDFNLETFTFDGNIWENIDHMLAYEVVLSTSVVYDNNIYLIGGKNYVNGIIDTMQVYDGNSWTKSAIKLNTARYNASSIVYDNNIYIFGGEDANDTRLNTFEIFNGTEWSLGSFNLPAARSLLNTAVINLNV